MPKECLPPHLQDELHTDWIWPFSKIPRSANAFCGDGPVWVEGPNYQSKPIPDPGFQCAHTHDKNGAKRPYTARTFANGYHVRQGYRWDDVDHYYNWLPISFGFEYKDGQPI